MCREKSGSLTTAQSICRNGTTCHQSCCKTSGESKNWRRAPRSSGCNLSIRRIAGRCDLVCPARSLVRLPCEVKWRDCTSISYYSYCSILEPTFFPDPCLRFDFFLTQWVVVAWAVVIDDVSRSRWLELRVIRTKGAPLYCGEPQVTERALLI